MVGKKKEEKEMPFKKVIAIQNVDEETWENVQRFLAHNKRIPSISKLAMAALENYLALANRYGIDHDWKVKIPSNGDRHDAS
jgi:hypothetical protein